VFRLCGLSLLLHITVRKTSRLTFSIAVDSSLVRCSKSTKNLMDSRRVDWTRLRQWRTPPPSPTLNLDRVESVGGYVPLLVGTLTYGRQQDGRRRKFL